MCSLGKGAVVESPVGGIPVHKTRFEVLGTEDDEEEKFPMIEVVKVPEASGTRVRKLINKFERVPRKRWSKMDCGADCECGTAHLIQQVESGTKSGKEGTGSKVMNLSFQVADVQKPLVSVKRIAEKGNYVSFGPGAEDNYILSKGTGDKLMLRPNGRGSYMMDVNFVNGERTEITVDSGAEESVCPWDWGAQFAVVPAERWMAFRNASGGLINQYGTREVRVVSPF